MNSYNACRIAREERLRKETRQDGKICEVKCILLTPEEEFETEVRKICDDQDFNNIPLEHFESILRTECDNILTHKQRIWERRYENLYDEREIIKRRVMTETWLRHEETRLANQRTFFENQRNANLSSGEHFMRGDCVLF